MYFLIKIFFVSMCITNSFSKSSFTLLLDTTLSMEEEIDEIKKNVGLVLNYINLSEVEKFALVAFNDPDVSPPLVSYSSSDLIRSLNNITVSGGEDCPENSVTGIKTALEVSNGESHVFVFTDAYAKDQSKLYDVQNLCRDNNKQVIIFLTGECLPVLPPASKQTQGLVDVYHEIAKACHGGFFRLEPSNLKDAFKLMTEIMKTKWTNIKTQDIYKDIQFSVESSETKIMLTVYGVSPHVQVIDEFGQDAQTEKVIDTENSVVIKLLEPAAGRYRAKIRSHGPTGATLYRRHIEHFPFLYGFTTRLPNTFKETSLRPIPGRSNYILISAENSTTMLPKYLEMFSVDTDQKVTKMLENHAKNTRFYYTKAFFGNETSFQISITSHDTSNHLQNVSHSTIIIEPQKPVTNVAWAQPNIEILDMDQSIIKYGDAVSLACKIIGYPKPTVTWTDDDGNMFAAEDVLIEIPNVYISYANIQNLTKNTTVYCKARNAVGDTSGSLELFVHRNAFFAVKQTPKDDTIEYEKEVKLYCEVEAYPEATLTWFHNETKLVPTFFDSVEIKPQEHALIIKKMTLDDVGEYKCEVKNEFETKRFTATIYISGLEVPQIEMIPGDLVLKPGDWKEIECTTKGKPKPNTEWKFKRNDASDWTTIPEGVYSYDTNNKLKISAFHKGQSGLYRCEASNILGQDYRDVMVTAQYEPVIKNVANVVTVKEGESVELFCEVDAIPVARVRWEMTQDNVIIPFDHRHSTDDNHTHRFEAFWKDSGNYHCIAENAIGRSEISVTVNVLVTPYIQPPESKTLVFSRGSTISLICNVLFGNPVPSLEWEFISPNSTTTVLNRTNNITAELQILDASKTNEGAYICIANNEVGADNIRIDVRVQ